MNYRGAGELESGIACSKLDQRVLSGELRYSRGTLLLLTMLIELPQGFTVVSSKAHGVSFWAKTGRIDVQLAHGTPKTFFIKVISGETGKKMMYSQFECTKAVHSLLSDFTTRPLAWGTYETIPDTHFFLCEFREMKAEMPDPHQFAARLTKLHQNSKSPNGKFGFHTNTFMGNLPQLSGWESNWETYFTRLLRLALDLELKAKGPDPEADLLIPILFEKVVPRLLHPLDSEGRSVKPSLVHGDLWFANTGIDVKTGQSLIFDACSFCVHNECRSLEYTSDKYGGC